jgi:hypothetical protein
MNLLVRFCLMFTLFVSISSCGSSEPGSRPHEATAGSHEAARKILLDYANQYEALYLQGDDPSIRRRLSEVTQEYRARMSYLTEEGKWSPSQEMGKAIKLSFLTGQFQGALQSCKVEKAHGDSRTMGCDEVKRLKKAMEGLCSE